MTMRSAPIVLAACLLLAGCGLIEVDRLEVRQGNDLDVRQIRALEVGMTRTEVVELLGTPVVENPFHRDRWDYLYYTTEAGEGLKAPPRRLSVHFRDDRVSRVEDRYRSAEGGS